MSETLVMKCTFENILSMTENAKQYSQEEVHGGVPWDFEIRREKDHLSLYLTCNRSWKFDEWSVKAEVDFKMNTKNQNYSKTFTQLFTNKNVSWGYLKFAPWEKLEEELKDTDGSLEVEFLASQSSHFKTLLMGEEPENLPSLTQHDTVRQLLLMSEWFKADTVTRRCEEFLVQKSDKLPKRKFDLALTFDLHKLKKHCVQSFHSISEMRTAIPSDLSRIDREFLEELFRKSLSF
ncbi:hypothetical protein CAEBREN_10817 [Caenorhabditis brenneri]|uniref:MATH domain-containing protein n=1 Tax=Caenorhabditis brenneri TaxID=135651 RepID=G0P3J4_CAEBE|nr:hypothetical protein CAEBREN_10817 [Caenorhabditis brenneri]